MKGSYRIATLTATLLTTTVLLGSGRCVFAADAASPKGIKNIVLVHGAFADGSGWEAVSKILEQDGYTVSVPQPPETSYADDVKYARAAVDAMDGPVVIVGHSYGGAIITEAGNDPKVKALVYIAAFALDEGESCASIETAVPQASKAFKADANGDWWIEEAHFAADFAADVPPAVSHFMAISQVPISGDSFTHKVTSPAWRTKPTWYMVASSDRSINPEQERMMAKRAHAKTVEVNSSHVAYMSHPKEAAKLIEEAATSASANHQPIGGRSMRPSIVFSHGIWADGSCFQKLIPTLRAEGHEVIAAQYGLDTVKADVDATIRSFGRVSGPIVLVGHSYGGTVITHAGVDNRRASSGLPISRRPLIFSRGSTMEASHAVAPQSRARCHPRRRKSGLVVSRRTGQRGHRPSVLSAVLQGPAPIEIRPADPTDWRREQ